MEYIALNCINIGIQIWKNTPALTVHHSLFCMSSRQNNRPIPDLPDKSIDIENEQKESNSSGL